MRFLRLPPICEDDTGDLVNLDAIVYIMEPQAEEYDRIVVNVRFAYPIPALYAMGSPGEDTEWQELFAYDPSVHEKPLTSIKARAKMNKVYQEFIRQLTDDTIPIVNCPDLDLNMEWYDSNKKTLRVASRKS